MCKKIYCLFASLVAAMLIFAAPIFAQDTVAEDEIAGETRESKFGTCSEDGTICVGPSASLFAIQMKFDNGNTNVDFGLIPGVGYGVSIKKSRLVNVGVAGYIATKVDDPQGVDATLVISYMEYVRVGAGISFVEGIGATSCLVFGIGADLF